MTGYNVYLLDPELVGTPPQIRCKVYLRRRFGDESGLEQDMGVPAQTFTLGPANVASSSPTLQTGLRQAIEAMYNGLKVSNQDLMTGIGETTGLDGFFASKAWRRVKP